MVPAPGVTFDAIVLAGGAARRLDGADKAGIEVGERTLLDRVLDAVDDAVSVVVVGERRDTDRDVTWTREVPVGAGPAAAINAGLIHTSADLVAIVAVDHPLLSSETFAGLGEAVGSHDGAVIVARERLQYLVGLYRRSSLVDAFDRAGDLRDAAVHSVIESLDLATVEDDRAGLDVDTWDDLRHVQAATDTGGRR